MVFGTKFWISSQPFFQLRSMTPHFFFCFSKLYMMGLVLGKNSKFKKSSGVATKAVSFLHQLFPKWSTVYLCKTAKNNLLTNQLITVPMAVCLYLLIYRVIVSLSWYKWKEWEERTEEGHFSKNFKNLSRHFESNSLIEYSFFHPDIVALTKHSKNKILGDGSLYMPKRISDHMINTCHRFP